MELTSVTMQADFWNQPRQAQATMRKLNEMKDIVEQFESLQTSLKEVAETQDVLKEDFDADVFVLLEAEYLELRNDFDAFEIKILLSHEYDHASAILELHPGAGGTESCDWADMLYRMYARWAQAKGYHVSVLHYLPGEEAGIKSVTFLVEGELAYGYLKAEKGVHRLVRISPFDAGGRRHTSFASVEVMPQFHDEIEIELKAEDLLIETKRASGAGGQHINKTDSAVRIVHQPTGLVATCQNGRSQHANKEAALRVLKSRLYQKMIEEQEAKMTEIKGEQKLIEWGSQIRSYVFHPYAMVKDHRTNYETNNTQAVINGDIDAFLFAYLKHKCK